jgi:hypothetical protein
MQLPNSIINVAIVQLDETCITHKGTSQDKGLHAIVFSKNKLQYFAYQSDNIISLMSRDCNLLCITKNYELMICMIYKIAC